VPFVEKEQKIKRKYSKTLVHVLTNEKNTQKRDWYYDVYLNLIKKQTKKLHLTKRYILNLLFMKKIRRGTVKAEKHYKLSSDDESFVIVEDIT